MKKLINLLIAFSLAIPAYAQEVEMADKLRSEGKIYVLVCIILVVLLGLIAFLISIDRKASSLENRLDKNKPS